MAILSRLSNGEVNLDPERVPLPHLSLISLRVTQAAIADKEIDLAKTKQVLRDFSRECCR